ncbi:hypothetical protein [Roseateles chitinivorans]|uniref:hypothetical protein n=1 Tax=Roseateles chitinivorans TaxID=2917965 RepID=UPI003D66BC91
MPAITLNADAVYEKFLSLLDRPDDEAWGLVWSEDAATLLKLHHHEFLPTIRAQWRGWSNNRLDHLAFLLGSTGTAEEELLIVELLGAADANVVSRAREAREEFRPAGDA